MDVRKIDVEEQIRLLRERLAQDCEARITELREAARGVGFLSQELPTLIQRSAMLMVRAFEVSEAAADFGGQPMVDFKPAGYNGRVIQDTGEPLKPGHYRLLVAVIPVEAPGK